MVKLLKDVVVVRKDLIDRLMALPVHQDGLTVWLNGHGWQAVADEMDAAITVRNYCDQVGIRDPVHWDGGQMSPGGTFFPGGPVIVELVDCAGNVWLCNTSLGINDGRLELLVRVS